MWANSSGSCARAKANSTNPKAAAAEEAAEEAGCKEHAQGTWISDVCVYVYMYAHITVYSYIVYYSTLYKVL